MKNSALNISSESLRTRLKLKSLETQALFSKRHPHAVSFFKFKGFDLSKVREHSAKLLSTSALAGALLLNSPSPDMKFLPTPQELLAKFKIGNNDSDEPKKVPEKVDKQKIMIEELKSTLPPIPRPLNRDEEKLLEQLFSKTMEVPVRATLEGEHLNTTFGYIGAEQHLRRYPGDSLSSHGKGDVLKSGMAPGLGAWGYMAETKNEMSRDLEEKEKWYAVVQTLYLPDWNRRQPYLKDWYKFRKVMILNTDNGNAVVADVFDSGPAAWTGKQYGGSPEVMEYLGGAKYKKGKVIVFFVDDPDNKVPLGPISYN